MDSLIVEGNSSHPGHVTLAPHDHRLLDQPVQGDEVILAAGGDVPSIVAPGQTQQASIIAL